MAAEALVIVNGGTLVYCVLGPLKGHFLWVSQADGDAGVTAKYFVNGLSMQKPLLFSDIYSAPADIPAAVALFDAWYEAQQPSAWDPEPALERPTVSGIDPATAAAAAATLEVTITGTKFTEWSIATVQGVDLPTAFASATSISFMMDPDAHGATGAKTVKVRNGQLVSTGSGTFTVT